VGNNKKTVFFSKELLRFSFALSQNINKESIHKIDNVVFSSPFLAKTMTKKNIRKVLSFKSINS